MNTNNTAGTPTGTNNTSTAHFSVVPTSAVSTIDRSNSNSYDRIQLLELELSCFCLHSLARCHAHYSRAAIAAHAPAAVNARIQCRARHSKLGQFLLGQFERVEVRRTD